MIDDVDIAELFHENTKILPAQVGVEVEPFPPDEGEFARVQLPVVEMRNSCGLEEAIVRRRSQRQFARVGRLPARVLSRLLLFSCSYTGTVEVDESGPQPVRAMPSAGATYPIDIYAVVLRVSGIPAGAYRYSAQDNSLELVRAGQFGTQLGAWMLHQSFIADANVIFILAATMDRIKPQYRERGYRYALFEAGHIAQNLCLLCTGLGIGSVALGGFVDSAVNGLLRLDELNQISLYGVAAGILPNQG
jgi:SagB-type dehydrogenase family enzyme